MVVDTPLLEILRFFATFQGEHKALPYVFFFIGYHRLSQPVIIPLLAGGQLVLPEQKAHLGGKAGLLFEN